MNPICIICNSTAHFLMKKDGYEIYECPKCLLSFVHPQPRAEFLKEEVYSEKSGYQANKAKDLKMAIPNKKQQKLLGYFKSQPRGSFLDIGCSSGDLMYFMKKEGFDVKGVELNPRTAAIGRANGLEIFGGMLNEAGFAPNSFDYIHMGDLIEHVTDPVELIGQANSLLKKGGQLIIVTPNMDCFWSKSTRVLFKLFKIPWAVITPPHHLWQFSQGNLNELLDNNDFSQTKAWYGSVPSLKYELGSMHLLKKWKNGGRKVVDLIFMAFAFSVYSIIYGINKIVELFPVKRFSMAMIAQKHD